MIPGKAIIKDKVNITEIVKTHLEISMMFLELRNLKYCCFDTPELKKQEFISKGYDNKSA